MNKQFLFFTLLVSLFICSYDNISQLPAGVAGAPNESRCSQCHNSYQTDFNSSKLKVAFGSGETIYKNDSTYLISVSINGSAGKNYGFQAVIKDKDGNNIGAFKSIDANTGINQGYISHKTNVTNNKYSFNWTAPSKSLFSDSLGFYIAAVIGNKANGNKGDSVLTQDFPIYAFKEASSSMASHELGLIQINSISKFIVFDNSFIHQPYHLFDVNGVVLSEGFLQNSILELGHLSKGIYLLHIHNKTIKFVFI